MGLYRNLYPKVEALVLARASTGQIHGCEVRHIFVEWAAGRFCVDDHAEKLLRELVEEGVLLTLQRAPTVSQAAFAGITYSRTGYRDLPWGPGTVEHYWYRLKHG